MGTLVNIIVGSHVWVQDPDIAWIDGQVLDIKATDATILTTNGKIFQHRSENIHRHIQIGGDRGVETTAAPAPMTTTAILVTGGGMIEKNPTVFDKTHSRSLAISVRCSSPFSQSSSKSKNKGAATGA